MTKPTKGESIKVLDDGFVAYVDHMGGDEDVVESARVSTRRGFVSWEKYQRCKKCDWVNNYRDSILAMCRNDGAPHDWQDFPRGDLGNLDYMMANEHGTPFEMCEIKLHIRMPMDAWRQHIRHRTAAVNEYSTRYSPAIDSMAKTDPARWRLQGAGNRQGSGGYLTALGTVTRSDGRGSGESIDAPGEYLSRREAALHALAREVYEERLYVGVAREQARKDLPLSNYTEAYWKINLRNLLHYLGLRLHPHAQEEIRSYAEAIADFTRRLWPRTWSVWEERVLCGAHLSRSEKLLVLEALRCADASRPGVAALIKKLGA